MVVNLILAILFATATLVFNFKTLIFIQGNAYFTGGVWHTLKTKNNALVLGALLLALGVVLTLASFYILPAQITLMVFLVALATYYGADYYKKRTKYKFTKRAKRLFAAAAALLTAPQVFVSIYITNFYIAYPVQFLFIAISPLVACLAAAVILPFEEKNNQKYINKAKQKLSSLPLIKIGITGSYAKTSCKNILADMLSQRFKVYKTQGNYNTPMGICLATERLSDEDVFIAEMGARRKGNIKELCEIVKPTYAILTGVANQHLQTFKTIENIYNTKKALADAVPESGFAVFNGDNALSVKMASEHKGNKVVAASNFNQNSAVYAKDIRLSSDGGLFKICGLGEPFEVKTALLGKHNVSNIIMCAALAHKLGVTQGQIANAVANLKPVPHRLQLVPNTRGITIIDDSYNCNLDGATAALDVVKSFDGRKIVFTQGIIELGKQQFSENETLGTLVATVADMVILTGENTVAIQQGLQKANFNGEIHIFSSLFEAQENFATLLKQGDVLLIQNDLP
jgi:UDP-N-acetylmuramoyl-tripeptide--D-alanyl-D-alanine ligase